MYVNQREKKEGEEKEQDLEDDWPDKSLALNDGVSLQHLKVVLFICRMLIYDEQIGA